MGGIGGISKINGFSEGTARMRMHVKQSIISQKPLSSPKDIYEEMKEIGKADQESFWLLGMNVKNRLMLKEMLSLGGIDETILDVRILFKRLLVHGVPAFVCVHCHPSGVETPSEGDILITKKIQDGARILELRLLDHVIISDSGYYSFREKGML